MNEDIITTHVTLFEPNTGLTRKEPSSTQN